MKILILYSELAGYVLSCIQTLIKEKEAEILLFRWPVNKEAPFDFEFDARLEIHDRNEWSQEEMEKRISSFQPEAVLVSGWMDKGYLKICRQLRKKGIPVISGLDNQWTGSSRQHLASLLSPYLIKRNFDMMWVTGDRQKEYARRLGFSDQAIRKGFYSADWSLFDQAYQKYHPSKQENYPKSLLYVGRMLDFKGIGDLCEAFLKLADQSDWKLTLVGAGEYPIPNHPKIQLRGFVQPEELPSLAEEAGAFILPSHKEPWGVVLHEFGAAGLPLLASDACGAGDAFVEEGANGYIFKAASPMELKASLAKLFDRSDKELWEMGRKSHQISQSITPSSWADTFVSMVQQFQLTYG